MSALEIALLILVVYVVLLLILELVASKVQPEMENGVTLFINQDSGTIARKVYGFEYENKLYISSNHWFRQWYNAILENPAIEVERKGNRNAYTAVSIEGDENVEVSRVYKLGFVIRLMCGFAPRRFLRLDPAITEN